MTEPTATPSPHPAPIPWLKLGIAVAVLHLLTSFRFWYGTERWVDSWWLVSPDLLWTLAAATVLVLRFGDRAIIAHLCVLGLLWVTVYRTVDTLFPVFFDEVFVVHNHAYLAEGLWIYLTSDELSTTQTLLIPTLALGALTLGWIIAYRTVRTVLQATTRPHLAVALLATCQLAAIVFWLERASLPEHGSRIFGSSMLAQTLDQGLRFAGDQPWRNAQLVGERIEAAAAERRGFDPGLDGLHDADVYVFLLESYGRVAYTGRELLPRFKSRVAGWETELREDGFAVCSAHTESPAMGAMSLMARAELFAGLRIENYPQFQALRDTDAIGMPKIFAAAGYQTVDCQPKLHREDPRGRFWGFAQQLYARDTPYRRDGGSLYHWADAPDQYILQLALTRIIAPTKRPVFMSFFSATSHAPFSRIPPYYADWQAAADPRAFAPVQRYPISVASFYHHPQTPAALDATLTYTMQTTVGFAGELQRLGRKALLIVVGDHQPPVFVDRRRTRDVPIHIITNRADLLRPFTRRGFAAGLTPPRAAGSFRMARLLPRLLQDFAR